MSGRFQLKRPIYPLIGVFVSVLVIVLGLLTAKKAECLYFLGGIWLLLFIYGYWRACIAVLSVAVIVCGAFAGITYAITKDTAAAYAAANRILAVCVAIVPGLGLSAINLTRNLSQLKVPRIVTLGMLITLNFFPLLKLETAKIREAMKTRGAGSILNPKIFYRAFLIPLVMRLVNISDTLALSVETRGFSTDNTPYTVYRTIALRFADVVFALFAVAGGVILVII